MTNEERERSGLLIGWFEAGCHTETAFSTYHDMRRGVCRWCDRTEAELIAAGADWWIWPIQTPAARAPEARPLE